MSMRCSTSSCRTHNAEIARTLFIAETTVKTHVNHALDKLALRDRVGAVMSAYENQLVTPSRSTTPHRH